MSSLRELQMRNQPCCLAYAVYMFNWYARMLNIAPHNLISRTFSIHMRD